MSGGRQRRRIAVLLAAALLLSGCGSDEPDIDPDVLELDDLEAIEPAPDPEPVDDEPEPEPVDDAPSEDEPAGELDGVIPESAFEINDDLDADEDAQRELLRLYSRALYLIDEVLAGQEVSDDDLLAVISPAELELLRDGERALAESGEVQISEDVTYHFARVVRVDGSGVLVEHCQENGPRTGIFDAVSGELVLDSDPFELYTASLVLIVEGDEQVRRVLEDTTRAVRSDCG